ncbi:MAG: hypothetical protein KGH63_00910 [Candidatus Micrarchaeota archaeon]|nr:hypothetical protein [Candidatus Micrarchaeota archaeon]
MADKPKGGAARKAAVLSTALLLTLTPVKSAAQPASGARWAGKPPAAASALKGTPSQDRLRKQSALADSMAAAWASAAARFKSVVGPLPTPRQFRVELIESYNAEPESGPEGETPACGDFEILKLSRRAFEAVYVQPSIDSVPDQRQIQELANFAVVRLAGEKAGSSALGGWASDDVVPLLFSRVADSPSKASLDTASSDLFLAGFAAFLLDPKDPETFLRVYSNGDLQSMVRAIEKKLGAGVYMSVSSAPLRDQDKLRVLLDTLAAEGRLRMLDDFTAFMARLGYDCRATELKDPVTRQYIPAGQYLKSIGSN